MTKQSKSIIAYISAVPIIAGVLFFLINAAFVSEGEFAPIRSDVSTLKTDLRALREGVELSNCLALAEKQQTPWQECL